MKDDKLRELEEFVNVNIEKFHPADYDECYAISIGKKIEGKWLELTVQAVPDLIKHCRQLEKDKEKLEVLQDIDADTINNYAEAVAKFKTYIRQLEKDKAERLKSFAKQADIIKRYEDLVLTGQEANAELKKEIERLKRENQNENVRSGISR